jgi:transcription-repair coupling factor (superfamily II helicase)
LSPAPKLLVVEDDKEAKNAKATFEIFGISSVVLPDFRVFFGDDLRSFYQEKREYLLGLFKFYQNQEANSLIVPLHTLKLPAPKREFFETFTIEFAQTLDLENLKDRLFYWGYHFVDIITQKGEVSFRGDIIDIFPPNSNHPYRLSLFGDEVDGIFQFELKSQRRFKEELEDVEILPAFLALNQKSWERLQKNIDRSSFDGFIKDIDSFGLWALEEMGEYLLEKYPASFIRDFSLELEELESFGKTQKIISKYSNHIIPKSDSFKEINPIDIDGLIELHKDKKIKIVVKSQSKLRASSLKNFDGVEFIYSDGVVNLIGKDELIISLNSKNEPPKRVRKSALILDEIDIGDYVVHQDYGLGIFRGIENRSTLGVERDFIVIEYKNGDMLYIPVENLDLIDRYIADSGSLPSLDKLGKGGFKTLKSKVKSKLFAIASDIVNLSAKRALQKGKTLSCDDVEFLKFLSDAGFEHTPDQLEAIKSIKEELKSGKIMDRLLSADVGFGKTEVAMSAMFIAISSGFQSMIIAPTTLLSAQHYKTLQERFKNWGIKVGKLDRYTTPKEKKAILESLKSGELKAVVGTHALLKAEFKDLALVVVDEEHKFGVKQKEAIKHLSLNTHMLSMSATPIPRSLNMALSQIKSFSEITTPPTQRIGVRTFVKEFDHKIIKEAIQRELRRAGQIFYIYNSIATIQAKADEIKELLPSLKISILHSKVPPAKIEEEMMKFEAKEYDILISTTIIESGIHLPNVNTIIVDGAENFGIADLHQLRGRVGRGSKEGYCYLMVEDRDSLSPKAQKRLLALETHSELGSGAILAMYDLEIRGGGNLIGEAQSGHIKQIGYSLYLKMLEETIRELTGKNEDTPKSIEINLQVNAYLSDEVIYEDRLRLELYRRLSLAESLLEVYEIEDEIKDRFGSLDKVSKQYIELIIIKVLAKKLNISKISSYNERIFVEFYDREDRKIINSPSRDSDDILDTTLKYLKAL